MSPERIEELWIKYTTFMGPDHRHMLRHGFEQALREAIERHTAFAHAVLLLDLEDRIAAGQHDLNKARELIAELTKLTEPVWPTKG